MKCNKCNHMLPDDSEFCQYCGNKIEAAPMVEPIEDASEDIENMSGEDALKMLMEVQVKATKEAFDANSQHQPDNEDDSNFGLVPEKPIYTLARKSVDGEKEYLNKLYTDNGEKIKYTRRGSTSVDGVNGITDIYDTYLPSGQPYKTIYINMYGAKASTKAPEGFVLNNPLTLKPIPKKEKPIKTKYCSRCGSVVDNKTKICTGCGKKYFKGIRFNKFSITVIIISLAFISSVIVNIYQYNEIDDLSWSEDYLEDKVSDLENQVETLQDERWENLSKLRFFDNHAEIVGDDGTDVYHKWGCSRLDTSDGLWIFNSEYAKGRGYTKCFLCH